MSDGDETSFLGEPGEVESEVDEISGQGWHGRRRIVVACLVGVGLLVAIAALAFATGSRGHRHLAVQSTDGGDATATSESITTSVASSSDSAVTSSNAVQTTVGGIVVGSTQSTVATSVSSPDSTTTDAVTATTLLCPGDGAGGPGCPPVSPLSSNMLSANQFSCAIAADGQVYCWGSDDHAQLGVGPLSSPNGPVGYSLTAIAVPGMRHATEIAVGGDHACAIVPGGDVWCWGRDDLGQIGHDDATLNPHPPQPYSSYPIAVPGMHTATSVAAGMNHSCATLAHGTVWCWGANNAGQLGNGSAAPSSFAPVQVSGITSAARVVANEDHTCALLTSGAIRCWGDNSRGGLGDGMTSNATTPVAVVGIDHAVQADLGSTYGCALLADGHVQCWGNNDSGELGDGTNITSLVPVTVHEIADARAISTGSTTTCVIEGTGQVWCWGEGTTGQLGDGKWQDSTTPVSVTGITDAQAIAGHDPTKCVTLADTSLRCWGWNMTGSLGDGTQTHSDTPVAVIGYP